MAVQAQYPSNILLLNNRNGQEGNEYSLQPQSGGGLILDQPHMLYNNNGNGSITTNSRKRGRDATGTGTGVGHTTSPNVINQFSLQSQPPQLIHLSQLHNHQQNAVSTGLRLSFDDQNNQQQQQRLQLHQHQSQQQHSFHSSNFLSLLSEGFASQIKQQRDEIDQFLQAQGEELRRALMEKRQRHYRALLTAAEARRLREKEAEVEKATRKNAELEARAAQLSVEAQVWQAKARAQEAAAASLQAQLQQTIMCHGGEDGGGGVSCAVEGQAEDAESAYVDPERVVTAATQPKCRGCGRRVASIVVLPCRHLCVCSECDVHFPACPVCLTIKNSTVEVFLS